MTSNADQEEYRQACFYALHDDRRRCPHQVRSDEDPCQHPDEACLHHLGEQDVKEEDMVHAHRRDEPKVFRLSEPRRASQWLKMFHVACNGFPMRFESLYDGYCKCCEPFSPEGSPMMPATPLESPMPKGKQKSEQEDQPQELWLEEEDRQEQQAPKEKLQSTQAGQRPTQPTGAPLISRTEFLQVLSNTFHGMRVYNPDGRVRSWSSHAKSSRACAKYIIAGICFRKEPLTLGSTQREKNLRRLK